MNENRNASIDVFRIVCAVFIVMIHTGPVEGGGTFGSFFANVMPRLAVPFFFSVSGYYSIQRIENGEKTVVYTLKKIFSVYFVWSCVYWLQRFLQWGYLDPRGYLKWLVGSNAVSFFLKGSVGHFWYFPALAVAMIASWCFIKSVGGKTLIAVSAGCVLTGSLIGVYYELIKGIPVLYQFRELSGYVAIRRFAMQGFSYFGSGYLVYRIRRKYGQRLNGKRAVAYLLVAVSIWIIEAMTAMRMQWARSFVISIGQYLLILALLNFFLAYPLTEYAALGKICRKLANFTFYSHILVIDVCTSGYRFMFHRDPSNAVVFWGTIAICFAAGSLIAKSNKKWITRLIC